MKTWNETADVLAGARDALASGASCAIVILTSVRGSAYRRPGAKLLIREHGVIVGNVSGGCLENDLRERALKAIQSGEQELVHYNTGSDEDIIWGLGLGCDGELDLLIVPLVADKKHTWLHEAIPLLEDNDTVDLMWDLRTGTAQQPKIIRSGNGETSKGDFFIDRLEPPPELVVVGAGDDAIPLVDQAAMAGMRVTVVDHRAGYLDPKRFPLARSIKKLRPDSAAGALPVDHRTMVVIKNHALKTDKDWARFFDATAVKYIGILGPKKRGEQIREAMTSGRMERIYSPAGLDIGSEGAEQIAMSVVAEMMSVWTGRPAGHLRDRAGAIHG